MLDKGFFIVKARDEWALEIIVSEGPFNIAGKLFVIKR